MYTNNIFTYIIMSEAEIEDEYKHVMHVFNDLKHKTQHLPIQTTKLPKLDDCIAIFTLTKRNNEKYLCLSDYFHGKYRKNEDGTKKFSPFSPFVVVQTLRYFKARKILDLCAGWGDRLIGALARDDWIDYYCGIDPNKQLSNGYKNMIKTFSPKSSHSKYEMISQPTEMTHIPLPPHNNLYDLIFTSPPFFDKEVYLDDPDRSNYHDQSINKFPSFKDWYDNFLIYILANGTDLLKKDGYLVIHISYEYIEMLKRDLTCVKYLGIVYIGDPNHQGYIYEPMMVFQKVL